MLISMFSINFNAIFREDNIIHAIYQVTEYSEFGKDHLQKMRSYRERRT